jgi:adenosylcobinamide kinase/adenosylcobinamide-phosphate guanylyltransferase
LITFVLGGARSGKSRFALEKASAYKGKKIYIATAQAIDDEMKERIEKHKKERSGEWATFEEPLNISILISDIHRSYDVILLDCLTLWLSNLMTRRQNTEDRTQTIEIELENFLDAVKSLKSSSVCDLASGLCSLFVVSNEVGLGIVPDNALSRRFRDLSGYLNQRVAAIADEVYLVTAGIPLKIK